MQEGKVKLFWLRDEKKFPVACVASTVKDGRIVVALSVHNPADAFNKLRGRQIALARLEKFHATNTEVEVGTHTFAVSNNQPAPKRVIMSLVHLKQSFPVRVREAASHWLETHPPKEA